MTCFSQDDPLRYMIDRFKVTLACYSMYLHNAATNWGPSPQESYGPAPVGTSRSSLRLISLVMLPVPLIKTIIHISRSVSFFFE